MGKKFNVEYQVTYEPFATSTTVTGPVGKHLQAGTEDAPVLDHPAYLLMDELQAQWGGASAGLSFQIATSAVAFHFSRVFCMLRTAGQMFEILI